MSTRAKKTSGISSREALPLASQAADDSVKALVAAREAAASAAKSNATAAKAALITAEQLERAKPPAADPRDSPLGRIAGLEQTAWARLSPRHRNRWPKLAAIDERVNELDQRQAAIGAEFATAHEQRASAEQRHADQLAAWFQNEQPGERPGSDATELDERIADLKAEHDAIDRLRATVLAEKIEYVKRNRKSLARTAESEAQKARTTYEQQIDELERAREALIDARATEVWARVFPSETLTATPPTHALVGGPKRLRERWFSGLNSDLQAPSVFGLLRDDAMYLAEVISIEQKAAIQGVRPELLRDDGAVWGGSEEDLARQKREKERDIEQQTIAFGRRPPEYSGG